MSAANGKKATINRSVFQIYLVLHLNFGGADDLHRKLRPLASGFALGDMTGILHHTETARTELMPEDQIMKSTGYYVSAQYKCGRQANHLSAFPERLP